MLTAAIVTLWLTMMVVTTAVREKNLTWSQHDQDNRFIGHLFFGLIWPLYLGVWGMGALGKRLAQGELKLRRKVRKNEIAKGIPCPIDVLAQMAKASLLKDFRREYDHFKNDRVDLYAYCYSSQISRAEVNLTVGKVTLKTKELPDYVKEDLIEFYKQLAMVDSERNEAKLLADRRNLALDGIETLLAPEPERKRA